MEEMGYWEFMLAPEKNLTKAAHGDYIKVTMEDGSKAIVIDEAEWEVLTGAMRMALNTPAE